MKQKLFYCWFGETELPESARTYIQTWKMKMPTASIVEVNEQNFDVTSHPYVMQAYRAKKFAFVSDYARLQHLYKYGGIYLDTDVEMCQSLSELYSQTDVVLSMEYFEWELTGVNTGTIIAPPKHPFIAEILATYDDQEFVDCGEATQTINERITQILIDKGMELKNEVQYIEQVKLYPHQYFCTKNKSSYTIHHYASSWHDQQSLYRLIRRRIGKLLKKIVGPTVFVKIWPKR